ncbi:hypothetical protein E2C01_056076 [Portunus trituberculatus]|uniref:CCHC-type domain-containing protein n=1 Tax=Portunus trituberculatus TaxID=210409 RepID=A0A5B7GXZ2_PORTR|nr:hypothetical protein [Portunus trituberculatus]
MVKHKKVSGSREVVRRFVSRPLQCFSCYRYGHGKRSCKEASRCGNCSALDSHSEEHCNAAAYCFHCRDTHQARSRQCPRYRLEQDILQLINNQFISLGSARRELLYRQKDGTDATSYASLAARSSAESAGPKTTSATSRFVWAGGPVRLANRFALLSDDSVESSRPLCNGGSKVSVQPSVTPSVSDRASCDEGGVSMESSDDIVTAVPRGPTVSKSAVQPDPRPPMTGRSDDGSHHSLVARKAKVQRPGTSQLPVSSCRLIISSQVSHGQPLQKARASTAPK